MIPLRFVAIAIWGFVLPLVTVGPASSASALPGPMDLSESESLRGIQAIRVALTIYGLEHIRVRKEDLQTFIEQKLEGADVRIISSTALDGALDNRGSAGTLAITIRVRENPGSLGTRINSFAVTVQFLQPVTLRSSGRSGYAATWTKTSSGIVGNLRPQPIREVLSQLLESFSRDYRSVNPP